MSTHTPGPWTWWTSCSFRRLSARHDGDVLHAVIQRGDGHPDIHLPNGGWEGPDGLLIAAAPDLLQALLDIEHRAVCNSYGMGSDIAAIAAAAITKATQP